MAYAFWTRAASLRFRAEASPLDPEARRAFERDGILVLRGLTTRADLAVSGRTLLALYRRFGELPARHTLDLGDQCPASGDAGAWATVRSALPRGHRMGNPT